MNNYQFCQFIEETEDDIDPEVLITPTKTTTRNIDIPAIKSREGNESMPMRRRSTTTTPTDVISTKLPREASPASAAKSPPFFPPPPPMFNPGMIGGKPSDPSTRGASFNPDVMFCGFCTEENSGEASTPDLSDFSPPPPTFNPGVTGGKPSNLSTKSASLNQDVMFCGFCTDENSGEASAPELSESNSDSELNSMDSSDHTKAFLRTTFKLSKLQRSQGISNAITQQEHQYRNNDILVLRSLIRAIPGVRKVSIPTTDNIAHTRGRSSGLSLKNITVHHDASVLTGTLRHAFESAGYSASIRNTTSNTGVVGAGGTSSSSATSASAIDKPRTSIHSTTPNGQRLSSDGDSNQHWVQSSFDVQGICCASEIPAIRRIVKPLLGVAKVNINLMTKVVLVQHNYVEIQAPQIAESLTDQGFPAQIRKDGATTVQFNTPNCSGDDGEQFRIKSLADTLDQIGKSPFVESTLIVDGLRPDQVHWIERAVRNAFISVQVRAVYPSAISETIKVEHNPDLVSITDIRDFLRRDAIDDRGSFRFPSTAEVYIDGADTNLYLPSEDDYPNQPKINRDDRGFFSFLKRFHINVVLSGIFWILSMVSIIDEM